MSLLPYASLTHRRRAYRGDDVVLIDSQTPSGASTVSFASGITSAYSSIMFKFYDINPGTDSPYFEFQVDDAAGSNGYNDFNITSTFFESYEGEGGEGSNLAYTTGRDSAASTAFCDITGAIGNGSDESFAGELQIFNPSSSTYTKQFMARTQNHYPGNYAILVYSAGYIDTTTAINAVQFKFTAGVFDGIIKCWGIK